MANSDDKKKCGSRYCQRDELLEQTINFLKNSQYSDSDTEEEAMSLCRTYDAIDKEVCSGCSD